MKYSDEEKLRVMEESAATLERLRDFRVSEPDLTVKEWKSPTTVTHTGVEPKLDTAPDYVARIGYLERTLAEVLPSILKFMTNVEKEWSTLKQRVDASEKAHTEISKAVDELHKRITDQQRGISLDLRSVELGHQADLETLGDEVRKLRLALDDATAVNSELRRTIIRDRQLFYDYGSQ
jgi:hypothetical protein